MRFPSRRFAGYDSRKEAVANRTQALSAALHAQIDTLLQTAFDAAERGRGHVRRLIAEVHRHFTAEALPFSLLFAFVPAVYRSSGYRKMTNTTLFLDHDGSWTDLVFRGGMVAELGEQGWPDLAIDLRGPSV